MSELLTAAQMRAIEMAAIESGEVTGLELMERAGRGVVEAIFEEWPELAKTSQRAVVLCGPGNNGGDGFVVARLLKEWGWEVEVFLYGDAEKLPPDAKVNYVRWREMGEVGSYPDYDKRETWQCDLLVDALFGTGLTRGLPDLGELFWNLDDMVDCFEIEFGHELGRPAVVAVDIPSGVCADSGRDFPNSDDHFRFSARAHMTVTFHSKKPGHLLNDGPVGCGKTVVADIGLSRSDEPGSLSRQTLIEKHGERWLGRVISRAVEPPLSPYLSKETDEHKYAHGHALVLSGGVGKSGAARLAARGALRIGAGLVTLGVPPSAQMEVASQITALMLQRVEGSEGLESVLEDARLNALCLGPGLGLARARELVPVAVRAKHAPDVVLDADALSAFADEPAQLFDLLHERCVLTPHGGEFKRLFPDIHAKLVEVPTKGPAYSKVDATREAAKRVGCTVLFKGPDTVIADQMGRCSINSAHYERSAPWLATAGSGDVLAGFITGLLARGFSTMSAAETGAWLHVECALEFGPGLIAEDLPEQLPAVFRKLEL
ncbi:NAD(P)H-hydrate dehydratase [Shimia aestuarii]|uniref:Bifunctional NAD(P)H-hydrate repair enzyme n=1 Tax=Shimia aestuarii TaxID=254406 RepID=A0A1I4NBE9_9RHOB|nr:NAD(P)H-hydrate dehydratase [Shimia aestuarii]SFM12553.1 yjeF C-terminal region, hydroxyethylthiazole kinase-related/yjeF N-terminal region [Shimia aestuarii]